MENKNDYILFDFRKFTEGEESTIFTLDFISLNQ